MAHASSTNDGNPRENMLRKAAIAQVRL